jgi:hypothetical protein
MTTMEEFALIESQLGWLEDHLRKQALPANGVLMLDALDALACARALIAQLSNIGKSPVSADL